MATLGDLKNRIITEINRDDLSDDLADSLTNVITRAIDFYAAEPWWFNETRNATVTTTINSQYVDIPVDFRVFTGIYLIVGNVRYTLGKQTMAEIEELYSTPQFGQPTDYAPFGSQIRLWPTPMIAYQMVWLYDQNVAALVNDASSSFWTNEGQDLISNRSKFVLYRDFFRDNDGMAISKTAMDEAYLRLKGETNRRIGTGRMRAVW